QARLQARFGRNWRRKAPVESMMPLRLAKYGVPLAETAPAGLAAAGIEPALLPPAPKAGLPERPELSYDPQQEQNQEQQKQLGYEQEIEKRAPREEQFPGPLPHQIQQRQETTPRPEPTLIGSLPEPSGAKPPHMSTQHAPDAGVDAVAQAVPGPAPASPQHTETDPLGAPDSSGSRAGEAGPVQRPAEVAEPDSAAAHPFFGPATPVAVAAPPIPATVEVPPRQPVAATSAETAEESRTGARVPEQTPLVLPTARPTVLSGKGSAWESAAVDDGAAATARLPGQPAKEPDLDPVQQQIVTVAEWIVEAAESGGKLSGAEVARRLGLSPRTGQRRLDKAGEYLEEQRWHQGRAHLRSVRG
ncbi:DUF2637 domain-containing protein, partial [Streptomyces bacillaris]